MDIIGDDEGKSSSHLCKAPLIHWIIQVSLFALRPHIRQPAIPVTLADRIIDLEDPTDTTDTTVNGPLAQNYNNHSYSIRGATPETPSTARAQSVESHPPPPVPPAPPICPEGGGEHPPDSEVIVVSFPFGNAGAPIPGADREPSPLLDPGASIWAPFASRRDWEFVRWAKTHGLTSTALTEFLAIPEVRTSYFSLIMIT
jgi:hypothetical protein